jgi:hypothetical protein
LHLHSASVSVIGMAIGVAGCDWVILCGGLGTDGGKVNGYGCGKCGEEKVVCCVVCKTDKRHVNVDDACGAAQRSCQIKS